MVTNQISLTITEEDTSKYKRLDAFLSNKIEDMSRNLIKKYFENGLITSDKKIELKKLPIAGTTIIIQLPPPKDVDIIAEDIPLEIIFEDDHLIIINKHAGIVVHPAPGNEDGTIGNAILHHCPNLSGIGNEKRPGIVHRLDKGTTGIMVIAKDQKTHEGLVDLFSKHDIERKYEAIAIGARLPQKETLESLIARSPSNRLKMSTKVTNGKKALTHMTVLEYFKNFSHVELKLETGRTHQIRVHLSQLMNSPIVNDPLYGRQKEEKNLFPSKVKELLAKYEHPLLHAKVLGFIHPITKEKMYFEIEPPQIFKDVVESLRKHHAEYSS